MKLFEIGQRPQVLEGVRFLPRTVAPCKVESKAGPKSIFHNVKRRVGVGMRFQNSLIMKFVLCLVS